MRIDKIASWRKLLQKYYFSPSEWLVIPWHRTRSACTCLSRSKLLIGTMFPAKYATLEQPRSIRRQHKITLNKHFHSTPTRWNPPCFTWFIDAPQELKFASMIPYTDALKLFIALYLLGIVHWHHQMSHRITLICFCFMNAVGHLES